MPAYSIVVPAYNERDRIAASLDQILRFVAKEHWDAEIIVVNDGSRDDTAEIVRRYASAHPIIRLIENPGNRGKGYSVRNGVLHAKGELILFTDADLSSPIHEANKLFAALRSGAEVSIGSRWLNPALMTERQPVLRQIAGRVFNVLNRLILGLTFRDTQCGMKAFTGAAARQIFPRQHIERWGFDPEILFIARKLGYRTVEVGVEWAHDNRSKINPLVDGVQMFLEMLRIRWYSLTGKYAHAHMPQSGNQAASATPGS
ncbi:MAG TPA: dolichyl-phosphate beta-glucosyltransferase [Terriglobales bacterium]|nr:dolichyl-phosphate beta-glucosyltransferase [Terriglobales bacterium]